MVRHGGEPGAEGRGDPLFFLDYLDRKESLGTARLIRRAIVVALEEKKTRGRARVDPRRGGWLVTWDPPFSQIRRYANRTAKRGATSKRRRRAREHSARLIRFPH